MAVRLKDLIRLLEEAAPPELKETWDNPGLAVGDPDQLIEKVLVGLDVTVELIEEARQVGAQLLLTHHPLLFTRPDALTPATVLGSKLLLLIQNGLAAYSAHTNLDKASSGMNDDLMEILGFTDWQVLGEETAPGTGIGRSARINPVPLKTLAVQISQALEIEQLRLVGDPGRMIRSVAVINGSGAEFIREARIQGIDCVITGDTKYHEVLDALEEGICVIDPGHFASEWNVFSRAMAKIHAKASRELGPIEFIHSRQTRDPYSYL